MGTLCQKCTQKLGVTTHVSEISCRPDHAKLPNFVIVDVVGLSTTGRKTLWWNSIWMDPLSNYCSQKPSFPLEIVQNPFIGNSGWPRWSKFWMARWWKYFFFNFQRWDLVRFEPGEKNVSSEVSVPPPFINPPLTHNSLLASTKG